MKKKPFFYWAVAAFAAIAITRTASATTNVWTGTSGSDIFWLTPGNWSPSGPPGVGDEARFFNQGAVNDATPDNVVTANTTIERLWIGQTNPPNHNMTINAGVTLTIMGTADNGYGPLGSDPGAGGITADPSPTRVMSTIYVGTKSTNSSTQIVTGTISGGGTLVVNNPNNEINIRQFHPSGAAHRSILNLSGLNTFIANLGRIRVGDGEAQPENRAEGDLYLAATNNITLSGSNYQDNVQLVVGNNDVNQNQSNPSFLILGGQNVLNLDEMLVGGKKQPGTIRGTNSFPTPTLKMRGSDGVSRVRAIRIGDASDQPTSGNGTTGIASFTDDTVDILADTITVGKSQSTGAGAGSLSLGRLLLGPGTVDVNTLDVAFRMDNCAATNSAASGSVDFSNTTVTVNSLLRLGRNVPGQHPMIASLSLNGGSVTVRSNLVIQGAVSVTNTSGVLAFVQPNALTVSNLFLIGGTISNASLISATNSLIISSNGVILGNTAFDMGNDSSKGWDVTGVLGGSLVSSNSFFGGGTLTGNLVQGNGGTIGAGGNGTIGFLTINGNLTLNNGALAFDLGNNASSGNDQISVSGTVTANATNDVNITAVAGGFDTSSPYTLISSGSSVIGNQTHYRAAGPFALSRYVFTFDTTSVPNSVRMLVGGAGAKSLTWVGDGSANLWNAQGAANWNDGTGASTFFTLDNVSITDSGSASPAINLSGTLIPGSVIVNNVTKSYGITGTGGLAASGAFTKSGTNSLTFTNGAGNSFSSLVSVQNGTLVFGNTGLNTFKNGITLTGSGVVVFSGNNTNSVGTPDGSTALNIGTGTSVTVSNAGANVFPNPMQLDGTLTFNQTVAATLDATISGGGALIKNGAGTLTVNGNNSGLSTTVQINNGTVRVGSSAALGATGAIITNNATVDLAGMNLNSLPVTVSGTGVGGTGAIVNTGPPLITGTAGIGLNSITMAGDMTVGGSGPWDTDPVKNLGVWGINSGTLSTGGANYNLIKTGLNQFGLSGATVDAALGNIDVQQGLLALQGSISSLGDPGSNITIRAGATVSFFDTSTPTAKNFILFGDGATANLFNYDGANIIAGPITLNGTCVFGAAPFARGTPVSLTVSSPMGGSGGVLKSGLDSLIFAGTNNYTGNTLVNAGRLVLDGPNIGGGALTNISGTTLAGTGSNSGPVVVFGTLSPGDDSVAAATLGTGPLTLNGSTLVFDVDNSASDQVIVNGNLTLSGTISVQLNVGTLTVGQSYPLIHYSGSLIGGTNGLQLLPLSPGYVVNLYSNANTIGVVVGYLPLNKTWKGGAAGATTLWNTTSLNWLNAGNPDVFNAGDFATFDDSGTNIVSLVGSLPSAGVTLNNSVSNYYFGGTGKLTGVGGVLANGSASLVITNSGSNDFTGGLTIGQGGGYVVIGNGGANGSPGNGPITNFTAIAFNKSGTNSVNNNFYGTGTVTNLAGVLLLNGENSGADMVLDIVNSTLRPGSLTALGKITGTATIESGATLDVNGQNMGAKPVTVSGIGVGGNGAIINSGVAQNSALQSITLLGDTRFGGTNRWDLRAGSVSTLNGAFSITKVGPNQVSLVSITNVDAGLGDIDIQQGTFAVQNNTGQLGDPNRTIFIRTGATLDLFNLNLNPLNKIINVTNTGVITNESGTSIIIGPVSIVGKVTFGITNSLIITNIDSFTNSGVVTNITKTGNGVLTLISNTLPSSTVVDIVGGTIDINQQSTGSTLALGAGQTLRGNGNLAGTLQVNAGGTVAPGEATVGTLTVSNSVVLAGTTFMKISKTANTNDVLRTSGSVNYGGTLVVSNILGTLVGSESYKLFSAANYSGGFSTIIPAIPGAGLTWNTNNLTVNGTISVVGTGGGSPTTNAAITKVTLVGTNLVVHGTNNNVPNTSFHYVVLTSADITNALSNWTPIITNTFKSDGTFDYTNPIVPGTPRQFIDVKAIP